MLTHHDHLVSVVCSCVFSPINIVNELKTTRRPTNRIRRNQQQSSKRRSCPFWRRHNTAIFTTSQGGGEHDKFALRNAQYTSYHTTSLVIHQGSPPSFNCGGRIIRWSTTRPHQTSPRQHYFPGWFFTTFAISKNKTNNKRQRTNNTRRFQQHLLPQLRQDRATPSHRKRDSLLHAHHHNTKQQMEDTIHTTTIR